ncbi:hypothetical protein K1719_009265 [Acacia pycnantha]|nr:hypothetical protein K1719_009265 [Acacia pycnantha]
MALSGTPSIAEVGPTVIAVDDDVNSVYAVRWAIHNLLQKNSAGILIHISTKELVLHGNDVTSALTDYITDHSISNIVVGASHRNALTSKYKGLGVSNSLMRSVPECCTVHIISKGKVINIQPTGFSQSISIIPTISMEDTSSPRANSELDQLHNLLPDTSDSEDINRMLCSQLALLLPENQVITVNSHDLKRTSSNVKMILIQSPKKVVHQLKKN